MKQFMVNIGLPATFTDHFIALIPEQRNHINLLMTKRVLISYALSLDRTRIWANFSADTEAEVMEILAEFPLIEYMDIEVFELLFNESMNFILPEISLN